VFAVGIGLGVLAVGIGRCWLWQECMHLCGELIRCLQVLTHVADCLIELHAAGFVHRDIKPSNIMWLLRNRRWTIIDFGCAAHVGELASTGFSSAYAAPEALFACTTGESCIWVTEALDSWSVGILALELLTGKPVFDLLQPQEQVRRS
jgi:histidine kinase